MCDDGILVVHAGAFYRHWNVARDGSNGQIPHRKVIGKVLINVRPRTPSRGIGQPE